MLLRRQRFDSWAIYLLPLYILQPDVFFLKRDAERYTLIGYNEVRRRDANWLCLFLQGSQTVLLTVKHNYRRPLQSPVWVSPLGGPSRVFSGPAPLDTQDASGDLHLSSWLPGLYCFRRTSASTRSSSEKKQNHICPRARSSDGLASLRRPQLATNDANAAFGLDRHSKIFVVWKLWSHQRDRCRLFTQITTVSMTEAINQDRIETGVMLHQQ